MKHINILILSVVGLVGLGVAFASAERKMETADATSIFCSDFVPNEKASWNTGAVLYKWARANPGEVSRWTAFADGICAGQSPSEPAVATLHGRTLLAAGRMALPEPPPPTTPTTTTTTTTEPPPSDCTQTISSGLVSAIQNAVAGSTVCLTGGSYGNVSLSSLAKASTVTVRPVSGAVVTIGFVSLANVDYLTFTGAGGTMRMGGFGIDVSGSGANQGLATNSDHVTIAYAEMTGTGCVRARANTNQSILLDHLTFAGLGTGCNEGRLGFLGCTTDAGICSYNSNQPSGVRVSNSTFSNGGCSDGVQATQDADGFVIGPSNEFTGIKQSGCSTHADPIQFYGAHNTIVTGNYFHDNGDGTGGLESFDGNGDPTIVTNNVFVCTCVYPWSIYAGGGLNWVIEHNVIARGGNVGILQNNQSRNPSGNLVRDNVWSGGGSLQVQSGYGSNDHNLNSGQPGTGNITGMPVFVGGASPSTWAGYALASSSPGYQAGHDGSSMGIVP